MRRYTLCRSFVRGRSSMKSRHASRQTSHSPSMKLSWLWARLYLGLLTATETGWSIEMLSLRTFLWRIQMTIWISHLGRRNIWNWLTSVLQESWTRGKQQMCLSLTTLARGGIERQNSSWIQNPMTTQSTSSQSVALWVSSIWGGPCSQALTSRISCSRLPQCLAPLLSQIGPKVIGWVNRPVLRSRR